ncbi:hypothetical protein jhhlp_006866 [Lomentospora prolificans]|uniref:Methyltransferase n=1 Tax=Lomentospora prolificans TaxID=41688 RepID=A0A2N3N2Y0_9PEZI|nr:hypothetical protein jhhlp_006866 [Lomentospora prolificans]
MAIQSTRVPRGDVTATISFYAPPADGSIPYNLVRDPKPGEAVRNFGDDFQQILIRDVRGSEDSLTLDHDSVKVVRNLPPSTEQDFTDDASIKANFYPEVEDLLLKNVPGSSKVVIFDHTIRRADPNASRNPVLKAHIDQTLKAAEARVRRHLPEDEAEERLKGRYRIINVWRPLNKNPVESFPLAFASSASVRDADVIPVQHIYETFTGETASIAFHPDQQWQYLSGMTGDERLLLQCFDSEALKEGSKVRGGRLAHTAFDHPGTLPDAEGRESIEVRALVFGP